MAFKREKRNVKEAGKADPVSILRTEIVFKHSKQQGNYSSTNQTHGENRRTRLGELTQILHWQGPECGPHKRTTHGNDSNAKHTKRARKQHNAEGSHNGYHGANL